jgi:opacity protein-like surface antigen
MAGGATVYLFKLGGARLGVGAALSYGKGTGEALTITTGTGANAVTRVTPIMHTDALNVLPQISVNFGHKLGWSYLSAGLGTTRINASMDASPTTPAVTFPQAWNQAINFGGGAKWFMKEHLGASFDVRFVKLGSRAATETLPAAKRTQMWSISAGISIQ